MFQYKKYIHNCIKKKYSESTVINQNLLYSFRESRINFFNSCLKNLENNKKKKIDGNDIVNKFLKKVFLKKKLTILDKKKIYKYYTKFNIHLRLIKKNKKRTNNTTYLYLGYLLLKLSNLNKFQKLNCILKIVDNLSILRNISLGKQELKILKILLNFEKTCLEKISIQH